MLLFEEWSKDPVIRQQQIDLVFGRRKPQKKPIKRRTRPSKAWEVGEHQRFWHLEPWQQSFAQSLPRRPRCTDDFDLGVYPCRREIALGFRYIQYNIPERISWLVSDIDRTGAAQAWQVAGLPPPSLILENPANGHAHIALRLANPVFAFRPISKPLDFLASIERGYTRRVGADMAFSMTGLIKNALHPDWRVSRPFDGAYTLKELAAVLGKRETRPWTKTERQAGIGRNVTIFDEARALAYRTVLRFKDEGASFSDFMQGLLGTALEINRAAGFYAPLPYAEVYGIAKSIAKWTWKRFTPDAFKERQSYLGKRGNAKRWADHTPLHESKPWEAEGISRRMWFYRKAKAAEPPIALSPYQGG